MYKKQATKKRGNSRKTTTKRKSSKKVYIPAYKAIILCAVIIVICLCFLIVTNANDERKPVPQTSITERFEEKADNAAKTDKVTKTDKSTGSEKPKEQKKQSAKPIPVPTTAPEKTPAPAPAKAPAKNPAKTPAPAKSPDRAAPSDSAAAPSPNAAASRSPAPSPAAGKKYNFPKAVGAAQLIFVFDDAGQNNAHLEKFMSLPFPITVAVLPQLPSSVAAADRVRRSGNEVILHQPMQSISNTVNPGPGAITPDMSEAQVITQLFLNINEIGPVAGMNNHEGSAITADAEKMAIILQTASENGIYFLDSRTNVETKVPYVAGELGYGYYERNIFLDNEKTKDFALKELRRGLDIANKNGNVIMIGHIWSADFLPQFLQEVYPELKAAGYTFSTVGNSSALK